MNECDAALIFTGIDRQYVDVDSDLSVSVIQWLRHLSDEEVRRTTGGSADVDWYEIGLDGDYSEEYFKQWQDRVDAGEINHLSYENAINIVLETVNEVAVKARENCSLAAIQATVEIAKIQADAQDKVSFNERGLIGIINGSETDTILFFMVYYIPVNDTDDRYAIVSPGGFQVTGATYSPDLPGGTKIGSGGRAVRLVREGKSEISVLLNTEGGGFYNGYVKAPPDAMYARLLEIRADWEGKKDWTARLVGPLGWEKTVGTVTYTVIGLRRYDAPGPDLYILEPVRSIFSNDRGTGFEVHFQYNNPNVLQINATVKFNDAREENYIWTNPTYKDSLENPQVAQ